MGEKFTDEEFAFLRFARFGELPPPVRPEGTTPLKESEPAPGYEELAYDSWDRAIG